MLWFTWWKGKDREFIFQLTYRLLEYGGMVVQGSTSSLVLQILPQAWFTLGKSSSRFKEGTYSKHHCPLLQCFGMFGRTQQIEMYINLYLHEHLNPVPFLRNWAIGGLADGYRYVYLYCISINHIYIYIDRGIYYVYIYIYIWEHLLMFALEVICMCITSYFRRSPRECKQHVNLWHL